MRLKRILFIFNRSLGFLRDPIKVKMQTTSTKILGVYDTKKSDNTLIIKRGIKFEII